MKPELALCYYPTSVVFIDDSISFLNALERAVSPLVKCVRFNDPIRALNHANNVKNHDWNAHLQEDVNYYSDSEQFVQNTLNFWGKNLPDGERYNEISVVVVDYEMPEMDGLSFCRQLKNPNIKKILLTGRVDNEAVIDAFNDGIINYYINKSDANLEQRLVKAIKDMQNRYFIELSSYIKIRAIDHKSSLFNDTLLSQYFAQVLQQNAIKEYYFSTNPPRYRLTDQQGNSHIFLVYSRNDLNEQIRIIKEEAGPQWLVNSLKSGNYIPYFQSRDGYFDQESFNLDNCVFPAHIIEGNNTYYCALIPENAQGVDSRLLGGNDVLH